MSDQNNAPADRRIEASPQLISAYVERAHQMRNQELARLIGALFSLPRRLFARITEGKSVQSARPGQPAAS